ncbi:MAG TPA: DUF6265 family protein [Candidatus Elarobacter sp.]|jgi:hypothetical protein
MLVALALGFALADTTWLTGDWVMTSGDRCIEEHWTAPSANGQLGMSRTVKGGRTVEFEFLRIETRADGTFYVAQPGGRPPVDFKLISDTPSELVFVNPGHADHLARIMYRREGDDGLFARVEGRQGDKSFAVDYRYRRPANNASSLCGSVK